jgi:hypothetical protein
MLDDIGTRMSQLFLKEEPVDVAPISTDDNIILAYTNGSLRDFDQM